MNSFRFLNVNRYLATEMDARAIRSALDLGVIDALVGPQAWTPKALAADCRINPIGARFLFEMLENNGVVARSGETVALTEDFRHALAYRDLLESRIAFADLVWPDIHNLFTPLLTDLPQFMARSEVFNLFRYDRCLTVSEANLEATAAWTKFTTCLTKYESEAVTGLVDFDDARAMIDMGGNTGEFALRMCRANATMSATVVDLPVVCELGRRHIAATAERDEAARIAFHPVDMRSGPLPAPADLVSFKSVLHDWPDTEAERFLERAYSVTRKGGRLLIFEREPISAAAEKIGYVSAPDLVFLHFLRPADLYLRKLADLGCVAIEYQRVQLDMGFHLITARRPE